jgi:hypothetical protein
MTKPTKEEVEAIKNVAQDSLRQALYEAAKGVRISAAGTVALCDLALERLAMEPRPVEEIPKGALYVSREQGEPKSGAIYQQHGAPSANLRHTHGIPLFALPAPSKGER